MSTNQNQQLSNEEKKNEYFLPPNRTGKKTLVLDLDETLVHSQFGAFEVPSDVIIKINLDNEIHDIHVLVRPGVKEFLEKISKRFEIVIFTASISKYASPLLDILDKNNYCSFRLYRENCTFLNSSFVKDLKKLGRNLKDVIIVDNSPMAYCLNNENGIPILTWFEDKTDRELYKICPVLEFLSLVPDVRDYIKKIVINNELSYNQAMIVINEYNEMLRKKNEISKENNKENQSLNDNNNNRKQKDLVIIKKEKGAQQININIINNNITNYIYDNKINNKQSKEKNNSKNKENYNSNFNPSNIIASVQKNQTPTSANKENFIFSMNNKKSNINKNGKNTKSMKNLKNNVIVNINNNTASTISHKKCESTSNLQKNDIKKKKLEEVINTNIINKNNLNFNKLNNNSVNNSNSNRNVKNYSCNRENYKINSSNDENVLIKSANSKVKATISKFKRETNSSTEKTASEKLVIQKSGLKQNYGNLTSVHRKYKSLINFNPVSEKETDKNDLINSMDRNKIKKIENINNNYIYNKNNLNNNSQNFDSTAKRKSKNNKNNFLKTGGIKNKKQALLSNNYITKNKINIENSNLVKSKNQLNNSNFSFEKRQRDQSQFIINNNNIQNNKNKINNSLINSTTQKRCESMKSLSQNDDFQNNNFKKSIIHKPNNLSCCGINSNFIGNNRSNLRPKSSKAYMDKRNDSAKKQSGSNLHSTKNLKILNSEINEILQRRGIAMSTRINDQKITTTINKNNMNTNNSKVVQSKNKHKFNNK